MEVRSQRRRVESSAERGLASRTVEEKGGKRQDKVWRRKRGGKAERENAQHVANHPGPVVCPPFAIVAPPHAIPLTHPVCPLTCIAGVPGLLVSKICTSALSA